MSLISTLNAITALLRKQSTVQRPVLNASSFTARSVYFDWQMTRKSHDACRRLNSSTIVRHFPHGAVTRRVQPGRIDGAAHQSHNTAPRLSRVVCMCMRRQTPLSACKLIYIQQDFRTFRNPSGTNSSRYRHYIGLLDTEVTRQLVD